MKKIKVYTKTGDNGETSLFSGERVPKHNVRIKAYGTIDELNCWIGIIKSNDIDEKSKTELSSIQNKLMKIGTELALDDSYNLKINFEKINDEDIFFLEGSIDKMTEKLPELKNFILPGGNILVSYVHLARSVCRRAERCITELNETSKVSNKIIAFINRLSDYLFTLSRKFSYNFNCNEEKWIQERNN